MIEVQMQGVREKYGEAGLQFPFIPVGEYRRN
jgi:hypothetical protein